MSICMDQPGGLTHLDQVIYASPLVRISPCLRLDAFKIWKERIKQGGNAHFLLPVNGVCSFWRNSNGNDLQSM